MSQQADHPALASLTRNPQKPALYSREPYFREAFGDFENLLGAQTLTTVLRHGLIVVKPDGRALGKTSTVLDFYARHGFDVVDARPVTFTRSVWRSMWIYQMTQASVDRLLVNDLVIPGEGVALVLRDTGDGALPAAVRLCALKGPARMEEQSEDCLRRVVGQPNRIFSLVHSADEPADLVREMGILFSQQERRAMAAAMRSGELSKEASRLLAAVRRADERPRRIFNQDASRKEVVAAISQRLGAPDLTDASREALARVIDDVDSGRLLRVPEVFAILLDAGVTVDSWDLAMTVSFAMEHDAPGASKVIDNLGAAVWEEV